ncbi:MAG TPA: DUF5060 domain-containing protein [Opitutaceae bacterium]|nr:DUF5060 domain-containing protein [Opitutaceae bacterium]
MRTVPCALLALTSAAFAAGPVEFAFRPPTSEGNPFAREISAEVVTPSGKTLRLPAFYRGDGTFAIRARATEVGDYRLGAVSETNDSGKPASLEAQPVGKDTVAITAGQPMHQVAVAPKVSPPKFVLSDGEAFHPIGANLAWPREGAPAPYYKRSLKKWRDENLNWMRIWMSHWGGLNLDWLAKEHGRSPGIGALDNSVASSWDEIVADAEDAGVYFQWVLQHHGQYSSRVNSNWDENPWNKANPGGFLEKPADFFTDPKAIELTKQKYRYIVARWGYSPAIMAWELFNEVHWADPINIDKNDATVAAWHSTMAAAIREFDAYDHLITTSTENLGSSIYREMDYFQPHLYPSNILAAVRTFEPEPSALDRPVFYGEVGDDHQALSDAQKKSGVSIVTPIWASLMGSGRYASQPWLGWDLLERDRLGELGAVAHFAHATRIGTRENLEPFSAIVESNAKVPLVLDGGQAWQRHPAPSFELPLDGTMPLELAYVPRNYLTRDSHKLESFPARGTYTIDAPRDLAMRATITAVGANGGGSLRISGNGRTLAERSWQAGDKFPDEIAFNVPAGRQTLVVENSANTDWVEVLKIDLGVETSALASVGKRGESFIACWLWNREGVFTIDAPEPVEGTLVIDDVAAGTWSVTWWDTFHGKPAPPSTIEHAGGKLRLPTPPISRHSAVVIERLE